MAAISLGGQTFRSKGDARKHIQLTLRMLGAGTVIEPDHPAFPLFRDLFDRHPERTEKYGPGLARFRIDWDCGLTVRILRVDGTEIDASFNVALRGTPTATSENLREAMREEIVTQVLDFLDGWVPGQVCGLCGKPTCQPIHVDHVLPFSEIAREFLANEPAPPVEFDDGPHCKAVFRARDRDFAKRWYEHHFRRAQFRVVHAHCNMRRGAGA